MSPWHTRGSALACDDADDGLAAPGRGPVADGGVAHSDHGVDGLVGGEAEVGGDARVLAGQMRTHSPQPVQRSGSMVVMTCMGRT